MDQLELIAVVGQQRTGSTVLRTFIANALGCPDLGEVFYGQTDFKANYWGFVLEQAQQQPTSIIPTSWYGNWDSFVAYQSRRLQASQFVFDHKIEYFPSTLLTDQGGTWFFYRTSNVKFVFLERDNLAAQLASRLKAETTSDWGWLDGNLDEAKRNEFALKFEKRAQRDDELRSPGETVAASAPLERISVDVDFFERELKRLDDLNQWAKNYLTRYAPLLLSYEELFDAEANFSSAATKKIADFLGIDVERIDRRPFLKKQAPESFLSFFENSDELIERFQGTKYQWMFSSCCPSPSSTALTAQRHDLALRPQRMSASSIEQSADDVSS